MTSNSSHSAIDAAFGYERQYRDMFRGIDQSAFAEAARMQKEAARALGAVGMSYSDVMEQARQAQGIFRQYQELGIDRYIRESMFSLESSVAELTLNASTASQAAAKALETSGILKSLAGYENATTSSVIWQATEFASINEAWKRNIGGYADAARQARELAATFAAHQTDIIGSFDHLTRSSLLDLIKAAQALDIGDWDDAGEIDKVADDELQQRLIAAVLNFISKINRTINPAHWTPSDILAVLLFLYAYYDQPFTEADRQSLHNAEVHSEQAHESSEKILRALDAFNHAQSAQREFLDYVSNLPGGMVARRAYVRKRPDGSAKRIVTLHEGAPVAVVESQGRWRKVIYRDLLTDELRDGWVWGGSIEMLNARLGSE